MKKYTILFWISTAIIFVGEGVLPALTSQSQLAIDGITSLGYPPYFNMLLTAFKVLGALALVLPFVSPRIKEWAYAGFGIDFICAFVSLWVVNGVNAELLLPVFAFAMLAVSYVSRQKMAATV